MKERGGGGGKGGDAVGEDGAAVEDEGSGIDMLVEEEEVGVRVVADPGRGGRDREVVQEGGRGGVFCDALIFTTMELACSILMMAWLKV